MGAASRAGRGGEGFWACGEDWSVASTPPMLWGRGKAVRAAACMFCEGWPGMDHGGGGLLPSPQSICVGC